MHADVPEVRPAEPFTVFRAIPLKAALLAQLDAHPDGLTIDLSGVEEIDTAGVQLLLLLRREAESRACALSFSAPSEPVRAIFELFGLSAALRPMPAAGDGGESGGMVDKARNAVVQEARELLLIMEHTLACMAAGGGSSESVNEIFRVVHTIKGSAALLGFEHLIGFTHRLESALDHMRASDQEPAPPLQALLVDCCDYIAELVDAIAAHREAAEPDAGRRDRLELGLSDVLAGCVGPPDGMTAERNAPGSPAAHPGTGAGPRHWRIELRFARDVLRSGMDPVEFLRVLESLGSLPEVRTRAEALPPVADMDPESCYLSFSLLLAADCGRDEIENVFEFVREDSHIVVEPVESATIASLQGGPADDARASASAGAGNGADAAGGWPSEPAQAYVKVPVDRLDALIDLVGELVISGASAAEAAHREKSPAFQEAARSFETLVGRIRDATFTLRMIPISEVFQRFPRIVRGVARPLGKEVRLTMTGGETELDKSMIEKLSEPLMHIVRNALDHGLETVPERLAAGKPATGALHLAAYHDSGSMVIEVSDDGRGLNYALIRSKAVERGLLGADESLSEDQARSLLFEPGFSTRARATRLSGRGVGMDVVRQRIESLRGEAEIVSREGQGTMVRMRLPLTLAVIDGFLVAVGDSFFVIPREMMVECIDPRRHGIRYSAIDLRGEPLPCLRLGDAFGLPGRGSRRESVVVVQYGRAQRAGLVVDRLLGKIHTVIKPLGMLFDKVGGLSGSTILGDGRVALILDIPQLIQRAATAKAAHAEATDNARL